MQKNLTTGFVFLAVLCLAMPALAQNKTQKCGHIRASVDVKAGAEWSNGAFELGLMEDGGGWVVLSGEHQGKNCPVKSGQKLRFNFNDGAQHMLDVKATTKSDRVQLQESKPAIVLLDVVGKDGTAAIHFEITGSPNPKAKIDGCPGGNFYLEIEP